MRASVCTTWLKSSLSSSLLQSQLHRLPFQLEITWINCEVKTGWPIWWWSCWTETCGGGAQRLRCNTSISARGFIPVAFTPFTVWQIVVTAILWPFCLTHKQCKCYLRASERWGYYHQISCECEEMETTLRRGFIGEREGAPFCDHNNWQNMVWGRHTTAFQLSHKHS